MISSREFADLTGGVGLDPTPASDDPRLATWPNLITLSGYAAGLAWLAGGPPTLAFWSVLADEIDGEAARNLGEQSSFGDRLDHGVDLCMMALVGVRLGFGWLSLPFTLLGQIWLKEIGYSPPFGSTRAALMAYAVFTGA